MMMNQESDQLFDSLVMATTEPQVLCIQVTVEVDPEVAAARFLKMVCGY